MPFGEHKGKMLMDIPLKYLLYAADWTGAPHMLVERIRFLIYTADVYVALRDELINPYDDRTLPEILHKIVLGSP